MTSVLLVEDDANILGALEALLSSAGYSVETAPDGARALTVAHRMRPDIVISDCMMPVMDGLALLRAMKAHADLANVPFVLTSAVAMPPAGTAVDGFLRKPFAATRLLEMIGRLLPVHSA